jgi:hypothetical protein
MKIKKIEEKDFRFHVTLEPNWLEKLFGVKPKTEIYKDSGGTFYFGSGTVYYRQDGEKSENGGYIGEAIDKYRRAFKY